MGRRVYQPQVVECHRAAAREAQRGAAVGVSCRLDESLLLQQAWLGLVLGLGLGLGVGYP